MIKHTSWLRLNDKSSVLQKILTVVFCLLLSYTSFSQTLSASLDREKILLGEQVTLTLKLEDLNPGTSYLVGWVNLPDTGNHIEVVKRNTIDSVEVNGYQSYVQNIVITSFDSGKWNLPAIQIVVHEKNSEKQAVVKADPLTLEVLPVDVSDLKNYHDIKDIIDVEVKNDKWALITVIIITVIAAIALMVLLRYKKKAAPPTKANVPGASLLEWAMTELQKLQQQNFPPKIFYTKLDEIYREYFDEELGLHSKHLTSDEMMIRLKVYLQEENIRTKFYQAVRLTDAVKFAKYIPGVEQNAEAITITKRIIEQIDQQSHRIRMSNAY